MAWEAGHRPTIVQYWRATDYADFGDASDAHRNGFARRMREMMGEELVQANWTDEMEALFLAFVTAFYEFPDALTVVRRNYRGVPTFREPGFVNQLRNRTRQLTLKSQQGRLGTRLQLALKGAYSPTLAEDTQAIRGLMQCYLLRGFIPYARTNVRDIVGVPSNDFLARFAPLPGDARAASLAAFAAASVKVTNAEKFAWRGDDRSWATVTDAGGLLAKVISNAQYVSDINLSRPWHVFSDATFRNHMYFRRGQKDNCLDTCVSISMVGYDDVYPDEEFKTNACFPQLSVIVADRRTKAEIRYTPTGTQGVIEERRFVDIVRIYLIKLPAGTDYIDTGEAQHQYRSDRFPEIAVRGAPTLNLCGYVTYIRVHHGAGENMNEGFDAIPVKGSAHTDLRQPTEASRAVFNAAVTRFSRRWNPDGSRAVGPLAASYETIGMTRVHNGLLAGLPILIKKAL